MSWYQLLFEIKRRLLLVKCFFVGHQPAQEAPYCNAPYMCARCMFTEEQMNLWDGFTMPNLLNRGYTWLCDRRWEWFDTMDEWLYVRLRGRITPPRWWEY